MIENLNSEELLAVIFDYVAEIANEKKLERLLKLMADMGKDMIAADRCSLWILDKSSNELWTLVAHGLQEIRIPADSGLVGHSIRTGEPVLIDNAYEDSRFNSDVDRQSGYRTQAVLVIPILDNDGQIIGAYQAVNKNTPEGVFTQQDLRHLTLAASYSGKCIEAALLYQEIEETQKEILFVMGEIGESRSRETGDHVKRVAEYSRLLALKAGLNPNEAELVKLASPMHDIGKVAIPDRILNKPEKLTQDEFEIMKSHTEIGYSLLRNSNRKILKAASIIAWQHHEKWDGTGYPNGFAGEGIHIYGRITALADVFDALASKRSYKEAWTIENISEWFRQERGRHFDPQLVDLFLENLEEFVRIKQEYNG